MAPAESDGVSGEELLPIAGAAGLGLLGLLGAGLVLRRRRRAAEEEAEYVHDEWQEPAFEAPAPEAEVAEPFVAAPAPIVAPPAPRHDDVRSTYRWGMAPAVAPVAAPVAAAAPVAEQNGSHVEAAYRGPTPDNPSLSLKKRLKRAAFFDHRDALAAEGKAEPVALDAGLPGASDAPDANQRELERA